MPLADHPLGDLQARCAGGCDERALRRSVLIAAARGWALPDVVAVRCFDLGDGNSCIGTAWPRRSAKEVVLGSASALPVERDGHFDRVEQAESNRTLVGRSLEIGAAVVADAVGRTLGQRNVDGEPRDAARPRGGHQLLHVDARALQPVAALLRQNAHHGRHAHVPRLRWRSGPWLRMTLSSTVIVDRRVGHERVAADGPCSARQCRSTLVFNIDVDHVWGFLGGAAPGISEAAGKILANSGASDHDPWKSCFCATARVKGTRQVACRVGWIIR